MQHIYTATVYNFANRRIDIAVESEESDHRGDLYTIVQAVLGGRYGQWRMHDVKQVDALDGFEPVKAATVNGKTWAWLKYV